MLAFHLCLFGVFLTRCVVQGINPDRKVPEPAPKPQRKALPAPRVAGLITAPPHPAHLPALPAPSSSSSSAKPIAGAAKAVLDPLTQVSERWEWVELPYDCDDIPSVGDGNWVHVMDGGFALE